MEFQKRIYYNEKSFLLNQFLVLILPLYFTLSFTIRLGHLGQRYEGVLITIH